MSDTNPNQTSPPAGDTPAGNTPPTITPEVQALIDKAKNDAFMQAQSDFAGQLKAATGHDSLEAFNKAKLEQEGNFKALAETAQAEAAKTKAELQQERVRNAILSHAGDVHNADAFCTLVNGLVAVDDKGAMTFYGKPLAEGLTEYKKANAWLMKPTGNEGSSTQNPSGVLPTDKAKQDYQEAAKTGNVLAMLALNTGVQK